MRCKTKFIVALALLVTLAISCTPTNIDASSDESQVSSINSSSTSTTPIKTYTNPVFEPVFADPSVIRADDGSFYAYATSDFGEWNGVAESKLIPILHSYDLVNWTFVGSVFDSSNRPKWKPETFGIWAPDIIKINGVYNLYYSIAAWADAQNSAIGVATSTYPLGPWVDQGPVATTQDTGVKQSIDPYVFEHEGKIYMIWGSYYGLFITELTSDGLAIKDKNNITQIGGKRDFSVYEGAYMIERDEYYYLFLSLGNCCEGLNTNYYVNVVRAASPFGPFYGDDGKPLLGDGLGKLVVRNNAWFVGTGHNSVIKDDNGDYWILYHGYDTSKNGYYYNTCRRSLLIDKLEWSEDGWPYVKNYGASHRETPAPYIEGFE